MATKKQTKLVLDNGVSIPVVQKEESFVSDAQENSTNLIDKDDSLNEQNEINIESNDSPISQMVQNEIDGLNIQIDQYKNHIKENRKRITALTKGTKQSGPSKKSLMLEYLNMQVNQGLSLNGFVKFAMDEWDASPMYCSSVYKGFKKG